MARLYLGKWEMKRRDKEAHRKQETAYGGLLYWPQRMLLHFKRERSFPFLKEYLARDFHRSFNLPLMEESI